VDAAASMPSSRRACDAGEMDSPPRTWDGIVALDGRS